MSHQHLDSTVLLDHYNAGLTYKTIGALYGVDLGTVRNRLLKLDGFKPRTPWSHKRKHEIIEDYFDTINTPAKAYLFGLLMADGCNIEGSCVSLDLTDHELVVLFRNELCPKKTLKLLNRDRPGHKRIYACRIKSVALSRALAAQGMVQSKTHKLVYPNQIPQTLDAHFIRGYFDGDGSIYHVVPRNSPNYKRWRWCMAGREEFLRSVQARMARAVEVRGNIRKMKSIHSLCVEGNRQIERLCLWMYSEGPFLKRKHDRFLELLKR